ELERICGFIDRKAPIQQDFISHAKICDVCLFWLSYSLALMEAFCTTPRILFDAKSGLDKACPDQHAFHMLIHRTMHDRQFHPLIAEEEMKRNFGAPDSGEKNRLAWIWEHVSGCSFCGDYYQTMEYTTRVLREKYLVRICRGDEIVPCTEYTAREILFLAIKDSMTAYEPDRRKKPS
ncbi:MAG: hypothetical protein Q8P49_02155, partial [Candidatus Liptonbacteria bacterium]|nr:hypothetical protein [Candidatus Liptonbacteria bacterium]